MSEEIDERIDEVIEVERDRIADQLRALRNAWIQFHGAPCERSKGISDAIDVVLGADPAKRLPFIAEKSA